jgi:uncharacterized membrane protein/nitrite reductase/ring-hydroxylating ferredoxin subunit
MRSKANFKTHPIHPMLVPFPIAFFTGSLLFDIIGWTTSNEKLWQTGYYLQGAGIIFGILTAIPGLIDFLYTVPPKSTGKKRAAKHGLLNTTVLLIFSANFFCRMNTTISPVITLVLDVVGFILLSIAGWLGGTLVYRNQIGIDHRYAYAGKWKEKQFNNTGSAIEIASTVDLNENQMMLIHVDSNRIVVAKTEDKYVAFEDRCTHRGGSLAGGSITCGTVLCPWHGSQFDVYTGNVKAGPAEKSIKTFSLEEKNGKVFLKTP